jgi:proteasome lid subunit RPN8/RPN11
MALIPELVAHVEAAYPEEGCGVVFKGPNGLRAVPLKNVYDKYHARFPDQFPRTNKTAYRIDELELQKALDAAELNGETLVCVFHSHCDVGAYFSKEDSDMAAPDGIEMRPGLKWLVVAVDEGKVATYKVFTFVGGRFAEDESDRL